MRAVAVLLLLASCGGEITNSGNDGGGGGGGADAGTPDSAPPPPLPDASLMPMTLAETGLYSDPGGETLSPGVLEYEVNYELWSDGATKRRFVYLPADAPIDTSDMNFWKLPQGTRLWKEFTRDGVRVETRLLWKQGPSEEDWYAMSFAWDQGGTEAVAAEAGVSNALGTDQDIPSSTDCQTCHDRQPGFALGFSAIQLDHDRGDMNLAVLMAQSRLSAPPQASGVPAFPLPGDAVDQAAMGYLHGNCGPCHNPNSDVFRDRTQIEWHLDVAAMATVEDTTIYRTAVGVKPQISLAVDPPLSFVIAPGARESSAAYYRMNQRDPTEDSKVPMPPLATELTDQKGGVAAVGAWIDSLTQ